MGFRVTPWRVTPYGRNQGHRRVTAQGRARGVAGEEILTGRHDVFIWYATPGQGVFRRPRPAAAYFHGRDTRVPSSDRPTVRRATRALDWGAAACPGPATARQPALG